MIEFGGAWSLRLLSNPGSLSRPKPPRSCFSLQFSGRFNAADLTVASPLRQAREIADVSRCPHLPDPAPRAASLADLPGGGAVCVPRARHAPARQTVSTSPPFKPPDLLSYGGVRAPGPGRRFLARRCSRGIRMGRIRIAAGIAVSRAMRAAVQERIERVQVRPASLPTLHRQRRGNALSRVSANSIRRNRETLHGSPAKEGSANGCIRQQPDSVAFVQRSY